MNNKHFFYYFSFSLDDTVNVRTHFTYPNPCLYFQNHFNGIGAFDSNNDLSGEEWIRKQAHQYYGYAASAGMVNKGRREKCNDTDNGNTTDATTNNNKMESDLMIKLNNNNDVLTSNNNQAINLSVSPKIYEDEGVTSENDGTVNNNKHASDYVMKCNRKTANINDDLDNNELSDSCDNNDVSLRDNNDSSNASSHRPTTTCTTELPASAYISGRENNTIAVDRSIYSPHRIIDSKEQQLKRGKCA